MGVESKIDPDWAWAPFEPSPQVPWDMPLAAHLFRRAGFAASGQELQQAVAMSPAAAVDRLLDVAAEPASFRQAMASLVQASLATGSTRRLSAQWLYRMLHTPVPLLEKLTLFWHGHFATSGDKVADATLLQQQNALFREHALGDFAQLLLEVSRDPAMLIYLDSVSNRKSHPNENYAREIMELFCLGEGQYGEDDIRELARCFTGWEVRRGKFRLNRYQHDTGKKTVLNQTGQLTGEEAVKIVSQHPAAPRFIASKLIRFLVMDEPAPNESVLEALAAQLRADGFQIAPTVRRILASNLFYSEQAVGRKIRSPVELGVGFLRALEGTTDMQRLATSCEQLGQGLFFPPSVKGWDGGRTWINSSTLVGRSNLVRQLVTPGAAQFGGMDLASYLETQQVRSAEDFIGFFQHRLFAVEIPVAAKGQVAQLYRRDARSPHSIAAAAQLLCTLAEFQLA